ncbi:MAG: hypothetical protein HETSPECPRED_009017 [Heterodermia speciosa]|uniref:Uncharacterized protein n=1 Tax=Heterodermia speciosa TaxID=116794 RepID=A0A8H3FZF8_9LECA|nr:MAG: hypothetical protein HETSPECPRED_009017 [Heterodermia speciosa]
MRGLTKAAALLSSTLARAFVVPEPASSSAVGSTAPVVEYHDSEAHLSFEIDHFQRQNSFGEDTNFTLEIKSSERPCGEDNLTFLGHELQSVWDGSSATGELSLSNSFPPILANWQIHCLYNTAPSARNGPNGDDVAQVLSFGIQRTRKDLNVGFTISYKQIGAPTVLQFSPRSTEWNDIESDTEYWRTPSSAFIVPHHTNDDEAEEKEYLLESATNKQNAFSGRFGKVTQYVIQQLANFRKTAAKVVQSCHTHLKNLGSSIHKAMAKICPDYKYEPQKEKHLDSPATGSFSPSNLPLQAHPSPLTEAAPPASTRSLHTPTASPTVNSAPHPTPSVSPFSSPATTPTHFLKLVTVAFLLFSLLTYIIIYIRDPRRRADRAARREERRNIKLYRRAAWRHWWQTRICALRHRGCPRSRGTGTCETWDEKRTRVLEQENILEAVAQHEIRTLRQATRPNRNRHTSNIAAAEEGRNDFLYQSDSDSSERRRRRRQSMSTLPGYESEGTLPPGYTTVIEDTPDSSVVSTSPRISRDGLGTLTDSEDGKSIEDFSLNSLNPNLNIRPVGYQVRR